MKTVFTLFCALITSTVIAQPTLTASMNNPVTGNKFYSHDCSTASVAAGASGAAVSWSFGGLTQLSLDSTLYTACLGTPFCDSFPGSTLATYADSEYNYYVTDAAQFSASGVGMYFGNSVYYPDPQALMKYPMSYGTTAVDTFVSIQPAYSFYSRGVDSLIADGWGTLVIPSGTYTNALRVHYITYEKDSDMVAGMVDSSRSEAYIWYTPGFHSPLLIIGYDTFGSSTPIVSSVTYYTTTLTTPSAVADVHDAAAIQVYPNPATDVVHIVLPGNDDEVTVTISDIAGREVAMPMRVKAGTVNVDYNTSALAAGMYILRIQSGGETTVRKVAVQK